MKTYPSIAAAVADPTSNIARNMRAARSTMRDNAKVIEAWMATGLTREQAWAKALGR